MTLRPCYRATCDAPGCAAAEMVPHERTAAVRADLEALGWVVLKHRVRSERPGAARISYLCPSHRDQRPPGWREARAREIRHRAEREPHEIRPLSLSGIETPTVHLDAARRDAMCWMLTLATGSQLAVALAVGVSRQRMSQVVGSYEAALQRRMRSASGWQEPWAKRLRAAGAIR